MVNPEPDVLNSWNEVARYLDRGVRTVQRWHAQLGLPVHRKQDPGRNAVFALRSDLDAWIRSCPTERGRGVFAERGFTDTAVLNGRASRRTNHNKYLPEASAIAPLIEDSQMIRRNMRETEERLRQTIAQLYRTVEGMVVCGAQPSSDAGQVTFRIPLRPGEEPTMRAVNPNTEILNSWKEIAGYLGRGIRTIQRWETEFGLPVRRPHGYSRSAVFAIRAELDRWFRSDRARHLRGNGTNTPRAMDRQKEAWLQQQIFVETLRCTRHSREQLHAAIREFQQTLEKLVALPRNFERRLAVGQNLPPSNRLCGAGPV